MTGAATAPAAVQAALNTTMRHFVTGVTVLTCGSPAEAEGVTVSTLTTIPGDPPMVCIALRQGSRGLKSLLAAETFVANGLAADHEWLAQHFARRSRPRGLAQLPPRGWAEPSPHGAPRLQGVVSWLECRLERTVAAGDHELLMARVLSGDAIAGTPLVNFAGVLHTGLSSPPHPADPAPVTHPERKQ
ncbi:MULTISPECIES: flavin reductase family protein [Streptomyces]|uniref:Oxidoreductase n=2 Tax=Streptomyces TaxID=1883 RepID=A0A0B5F196_STRA4|nr:MULTISPECIES: flavin reductase family protein [Streptomyces]AJE85315.1 oxidoreductase [Streptomyces albus]AOU79622.1 oxidoreductase [Streptomyces albus]AYN35345.1 flavin reductase [Streptomyces albus]NKI40374.1 flavin reductase [Streptomyces physcomitrii]